MTPRDKLADWISGGALTFHKNGWARSSALHSETKGRNFCFSAALCQIRDMETPNANATVKRMAKIAREALK